jgi:hypothetical protein
MSDTPKRRAPAFPLYADDFIGGTVDLSQEEVGAYIRLLCYQWNRGSIPVDPAVQVRLAGGCVSVAVLAKFSAGENGQLRNLRLESVRSQKDKFIELQREKGRLSAEKRRLEQNRFNRGSTEVQPDAQPDAQPKVNLPSPSPSPIKKDIAPSSPWAVAFGLELPENLRTQNCLDAAKLWLEYKREKRQGYKRIGLQSTMTKWANDFTCATFPSAVDHSIANNWSGVFAPREQASRGNNRNHGAAIDFDKMTPQERLEYQMG